MGNDDEKLLKLVHQSGFAFQIGVCARKLNARLIGTGWSVTAEEFHLSQ